MSLDDELELLVTGTKDGQICVWEMHDIYSATLHSIHQSEYCIYFTVPYLQQNLKNLNADFAKYSLIMSPPFRVGRHIVFPQASVCLSVCLSQIVSAL